jgi:hypothetical protein
MMSHRLLPLLLIVLALTALVVLPAFALDNKDPKDKANTHEGMVVKAGDGKLVMTTKDEKTAHTMDVGKDAKITLDGKACKLEDLKEGMTVKVTTDDKDAAVAIDARSPKDKDK